MKLLILTLVDLNSASVLFELHGLHGSFAALTNSPMLPSLETLPLILSSQTAAWCPRRQWIDATYGFSVTVQLTGGSEMSMRFCCCLSLVSETTKLSCVTVSSNAIVLLSMPLSLNCDPLA